MGSVTLAELLAALVVVAGLGLSGWALIDDVWDLYHVYRFGEIGGPRWITAQEHFLFNGTLLLGWGAMLGLVSIAIYLPSQTTEPASTLSQWAGWLRFGFTAAVLVGQAHRRIGRWKLQSLPFDAWERMLTSMVDGIPPVERVAMMTRLLTATTAGREIGHLVANDLQRPVAVLDGVARDSATLPERRAEAVEALADLDHIMERVRRLHIEIKAQETGA